MLVKFLLYNPEHALNTDILSTFSSVLSFKTDVSTAPLFNIVKVLGSKTDVSTALLSYTVKTDGPATVRSPLQLFYVVKALFCGTLFEDRRPSCCYRSTSDLLPRIHFAKQRWTCCRSCHTTLWTLSMTCCCYCCCCTSIAIYW